MSIPIGTTVQTGINGAATLAFSDQSQVQLADLGELKLEELSASRVSVNQTAGNTINIIRANGNRVFETKTPTSSGQVQEATYIANVARSQPVAAPEPAPEPAPLPVPRPLVIDFPRIVPESSLLLTGQAVYEENGELWEVRTYADPATTETTDVFRLLGPAFPVVEEALFTDAGELVRRRTFRDPASGETWDTFEVLGRPPVQGLGTGQIAASVFSAPLRQQTFVLSQIILVRDPVTGRVGSIVLVPTNPALPPITLTQPGQVGSTSENNSATVQLSLSTASQIAQLVASATREAAAPGDRAAARALVATTTADVRAILAPVVVPDAVFATELPGTSTVVVEGPVTVTTTTGTTTVNPPGTTPSGGVIPADWLGYSTRNGGETNILARVLTGVEALMGGS